MASPSVYLSSPHRSLFKLPPSELPFALPPPSDASRIAAPFRIDPDLYQAALNYKVPLTFALIYITSVLSLNAFNRSRKWKPWWISRTRFFTPLVAFHNLSLALYSGITFLAMVRTMYVSMPYRDENTTLAHYADALCKMNGPRGLGDAVSYIPDTATWTSSNALIKLASGLPDSTDVGRIWNEGLAFWGWIFYLSKFYEVIDTLVILARGKRSPTLQTYHHAGAMLSMWAGMRFMSSPIWMFVYINSFIHTLMYVYFTLATLGVKVPKGIKQTLTTMQISQFLIGVTFAAFHLFVKYDVPVTVSYKIFSPIVSAASAASSVASVATSAVSTAVKDPAAITSLAAALASPSLGAFVKRLLLRAAGNEGAAENVRDSHHQLVFDGVQSAHLAASSASSAASSVASAATSAAAARKHKEETRYRTSLGTVDCVTTSGQAFAIWLNIIYLAPLTVLFVRFFVKAYITGTIHKKPGARRTSFTEAVNKASEDVVREGDNLGKEVERRLSEQVALRDQVIRDVKDVRDGKFGTSNSKPAQQRPSSGTSGREGAPAIPDRGSSKSGDQSDKKQQTPQTSPQKSPQTSQLLHPESAIEDSGDDDEDKSELDSSVGNLEGASPEKKKKKRNKKKKRSSAAAEDNAAKKEGGDTGKTEFAKAIKEEAPAKTDPAIKTEPAASEK